MTVDYSRRCSGLSRIPADSLSPVFVSSGHFLHGGMQTTSGLGYESIRYGRSEKKETFTFFCLSSFFQIAERVVSTNIFLSKSPLRPAREAAEPQTAAGEVRARWV